MSKPLEETCTDLCGISPPLAHTQLKNTAKEAGRQTAGEDPPQENKPSKGFSFGSFLEKLTSSTSIDKGSTSKGKGKGEGKGKGRKRNDSYPGVIESTDEIVTLSPRSTALAMEENESKGNSQSQTSSEESSVTEEINEEEAALRVLYEKGEIHHF